MLVYDRGAIKQPASTPATSGGNIQVIDTKQIRRFIVNVTNQGHGLSVYVWSLLSESCMDNGQG